METIGAKLLRLIRRKPAQPGGIPVVCDNGHTFYSENFLTGDARQSAFLGSVRTGPCPRCGAMGSVEPGRYVREGGVMRRAGDA